MLEGLESLQEYLLDGYIQGRLWVYSFYHTRYLHSILIIYGFLSTYKIDFLLGRWNKEEIPSIQTQTFSLN